MLPEICLQLLLAVRRGCVIIPLCGLCFSKCHPAQQYHAAVWLVATVLPLSSCFGHGLGGHVHHSQSSCIFCRCHRHAKIHVIHGGAFGDHVVGRSAKHHLYIWPRIVWTAGPSCGRFLGVFLFVSFVGQGQARQLAFESQSVSMWHLFLDRF